MADAASVIAASSSLASAAKKLGVDRSTIHRWIESGKVPRPGVRPAKADAPPPPDEAPTRNPQKWAAWVRESYALDATGNELLELAIVALYLVNDPDPKVRLSAIGRYQQVVKQLNLDMPAASSAKTNSDPPRVASAPSSRGRAIDPRGILTAAK